METYAISNNAENLFPIDLKEFENYLTDLTKNNPYSMWFTTGSVECCALYTFLRNKYFCEDKNRDYQIFVYMNRYKIKTNDYEIERYLPDWADEFQKRITDYGYFNRHVIEATKALSILKKIIQEMEMKYTYHVE